MTDQIISASSPKFHLDQREAFTPCNSRAKKHEGWQHKEENLAHCLINIASQCPKAYLMIH